jgi:hypothetical protein
LKLILHSMILNDDNEMFQDQVIAGRIKDILNHSHNGLHRVVILEIFQISTGRDEMFGMPVLTRRHAEVTFLIVPTLVGASKFISV